MRSCCHGVSLRATWLPMVAALAACALGADPAEEETVPPAGQEAAEVPAPPAGAAERVTAHLVGMYGAHLASPDWIARSMAVIGLAQIDDPRATAKLFETLDADANDLVRVFAWESLHARHERLDEAQRVRWRAAGRALASQGALRGDLRVGLVRMIAEEGPTSENLKLFDRLFETTSSLNPADFHTLLAMRGALAAWQTPELVKGLVGAMADLDKAYRAEFVLGGLDAGVPHSSTLLDKGSRAMWEETSAAWADWYRGARRRLTGSKPSWWGSRSALLPPPEKISDAGDPRWRKDLELRPLRLNQLDVVFAVDSTGSMGPVIGWLRRKVVKMMRAFGLISREPRIGLVFYRDHGDEYVVKPVPLTGNAETLVGAVNDIRAKGGGDVPEAVYEALATAVKKQRWVSNQRVIITAGDAPPHPDAMEKTKALVTASAAKGYRFHFIKAHTQYGSGDVAEFDALAALGKGSATAIAFTGEYPEDEKPVTGQNVRSTIQQRLSSGDSDASRQHLSRIAGADDTNHVDRQVVAAVLRSVLNEAYHDKVDAFVRVLLEYLERPVPEKRRHFKPRPPPPPTHQTGGPVVRPKPEEPDDPQKR